MEFLKQTPETELKTDRLQSIGQIATEMYGRDLERREALRQNYADYQEDVHEFIKNLPRDHQSSDYFLGAGSAAEVFRMPSSAHEGGEVALRIPYKVDAVTGQPTDYHRSFDAYVDGAVHTQGVDGFEQFHAFSYEDGVLISEIAPGAPLSNLSPEECQSISDEQIARLLDVVDSAHAHGIMIDQYADNVLYDPEHGFTVIDCEAVAEDKEPHELFDTMLTIFDKSGAFEDPDNYLLYCSEESRTQTAILYSKLLPHIEKRLPKEVAEQKIVEVKDFIEINLASE